MGRCFAPRDDGPQPAVIVLPGANGGVPTETAELLASHGYATLALAYFGEEGLPDELLEVPIEYVEQAVAWLGAQPRVDPERIGLLGGSKGGELALLVGSRVAALGAVVAVVPSSVAFQAVAAGWPRRSSWSIGGQPVPFVPYAASPRFRASGVLSDLYEDSLLDESAVARARIPVERLPCPLLLLSGEEDRVWPSAAMCDEIVRRLEQSGFAHGVEHLRFEDVGHELFAAGHRPVSWSPRVGGSRQAHARAQARGWARTLEFLDEALTR